MNMSHRKYQNKIEESVPKLNQISALVQKNKIILTGSPDNVNNLPQIRREVLLNEQLPATAQSTELSLSFFLQCTEQQIWKLKTNKHL